MIKSPLGKGLENALIFVREKKEVTDSSSKILYFRIKIPEEDGVKSDEGSQTIKGRKST